jgi:hypothetical protein
MPDDFNMEADANQMVPLEEQAPAGTPDQLANMERQQRKAYWKGEQAAASRLVPFLPREPLSGAMLEEAERIEQEVWDAQVKAEAAANVPVGPPTEDQQQANMNLRKVNQSGGELDPNALDEWTAWADRQIPDLDLWGRPEYERKALFFQWLREQEKNANSPKSIPAQEPPILDTDTVLL